MDRKKIKFRCWESKCKEMSYDINIDHFGHANDGQSFLTYSDKDVVMLFSGLVDINRKPIFEGDLVKWKGLQCLKQVWLKDGAFRTLNAKRSPSKEDNVLHSRKIHKLKIEIVGNVFENNSLIKIK